MTQKLIFAAAGILLACAVSPAVNAAVLYSGGNPGTTPSTDPPGSGMPWNYYQNSNVWSKAYAGVTLAVGEDWTVTGLEFYEAMLTTEEDPIQSVMWEIRSTVDDLGAAGEVAAGAVTGYTIEDTGLNMTYVYDYDIHKISITFDAPVVLTGGQDYYFAAQLYRGSFPDDLQTAIVFSDGTGAIGTAADDVTHVWYSLLGYSPFDDTYSSSEIALSVIGTSTIPEPSAALLVVAAAGGVTVLRRRRRRCGVKIE